MVDEFNKEFKKDYVAPVVYSKTKDQIICIVVFTFCLLMAPILVFITDQAIPPKHRIFGRRVEEKTD